MAENKQKKRKDFFDLFFNDFDDSFEQDFAKLQARMNELMHSAMMAQQGNMGMRSEGPFVYGFSMRVGPDGRPVINQFGNVPHKKKEGVSVEEREPLVDVITREKEISVIAEVPGVEKNDIQLKATPDSLSINVETKDRKYQKKIMVPQRILPNTAKATYKNGVLEVSFQRETEGKAEQGRNIPVH
jgi:HSP20 family protein